MNSILSCAISVTLDNVRKLAYDLASRIFLYAFQIFDSLNVRHNHPPLRHGAVSASKPSLSHVNTLSFNPRALSITHGTDTHLETRLCIHAYLGLHASTHPTVLAVQDTYGQQMTYGELQDRSTVLARSLHTLGARRGTRIVLIIERSIPHIIAIFAILQLGAAYIPLDGALCPESSLSEVIDDAHPVLILRSRAHSPRMNTSKHVWLCIEDLLECSAATSVYQGDIETASSQDPAYIIYTSGTTGKSKGVVVSHANVTNLVCQAPGNLGVTLGTRVAQLLNVAFDMCAWEIFSCLLNGGTLYLRGPRHADWIKVMKTVHVIIATPSILESHDPVDYPNVQVVATAGEPCSQQLADRWAKQVQFYNCCGPTEVTIVNTMHQHMSGAKNNIGKPTPNNSVYVLDSNLKPLPRGQIGLMWAGGAGVSLGYLNQPGLTNERFKPDVFRGTGMMYNTGDLGRVRDDGSLEHLGRIDDQVKVKGFRVELDGVAAAMRTCPGVLSACALLIGTELCGFYTPVAIPDLKVKEATALSQPFYAVPSKLITLETLPLTSNGKIDKRALRGIITGDTVGHRGGSSI